MTMAKVALSCLAFVLGALHDPKPPKQVEKAQYFCCGTVADDGQSGKECKSIPKAGVPYCTGELLVCRGSGYTWKEGAVTCTAPKK
jgi:hypothetical protein